MPERVHLREVGLRDGLQLVKTILSTERKREWCRRVSAAGVREVEVTSFVPARILPQFADADSVARGAVAIEGVTASALVLNLRGAERALDAGLRHITCVVSASEAHSLANSRRTTEEALAEFERIVALARSAVGSAVTIDVGIATAFGCSLSGRVPEARVRAVASRLVAMGADRITVADTVGYGDPTTVRRLTSALVREAGGVPVGAHFHDTRGLGLANVVAALDAGIRRFDGSLGGLGGCPFAPGATGNIDFEDCAFMLSAMGYDTGIDVAALIDLRKDVESWLPGEDFHGAIARAGMPDMNAGEHG